MFSQEENKTGVCLELGTFGGYTKNSGGMSGYQFFATPSYKIGDKTNIGIEAGLRLFRYYREESFRLSYPLYINTSYKFKSEKITPFVERKLGYTFLKDRSSGKTESVNFSWSSLYRPDSDPVEYRNERRLLLLPFFWVSFSVEK